MRVDEIPEVGPVPTRFPADVALVRRLVDAQFPQWAHLPISHVEDEGWDNRTFRLGDAMLVRLPSAAEYALAVEKEHRWLPVFARQLPLAVPTPVARGVPGEGYPHEWSVYQWLDGTPATTENIADLTEFAVGLGRFLAALQQVDPTDGPGPGLHNWYRGGPPATYDDQTQRALKKLRGRIDDRRANEIWQSALQATWTGGPVWFHGDVATGNLLINNGVLTGVIDFGTCGVGDPACDLAIAWTLLTGESRNAFRASLSVDADTWARGKGWALWKALVGYAGGDETLVRVLDQICADTP